MLRDVMTTAQTKKERKERKGRARKKKETIKGIDVGKIAGGLLFRASGGGSPKFYIWDGAGGNATNPKQINFPKRHSAC